MSTYYCILTEIGQAQVANAVALDQDVQLTAMAVGDGGGNPITPQTNMTELVNEVFRAQLNTLSVDPQDPGHVIAELVIPNNEGGWTVRECGLFNAAGDLFAVGSLPASDKPALGEGAGAELTVRMHLTMTTEQADAIEIKIDPTVVLASRGYVDESIATHGMDIDAHPDKADIIHSHSIAEVVGLQTALDSKAAISHTHVLKDLIARDGVILNAFRIAEYTDVATGSLVEGYEWLLRSANELALTDCFYDAYGPLVTNVTPTSYDNPMGKGDRTGSVTISASFSPGSGALSNALNGTDGDSAFTVPAGDVTGKRITFNFGTAQYISEVMLYISSHQGNWKWQYSDNGSSWTDVINGEFYSGADLPAQAIPLIDAGAHRYWSILGVSGNSTNNWWREFEFKILAEASRQKMNMTATATANITASSQPDDATVYFIHQAVDSVIMGTDCKVFITRDGDTTWTEGTIELIANYDGSYQLYKADADLTGQPSGSSMNFKIETFNLTEQRAHGVAMQWG